MKLAISNIAWRPEEEAAVRDLLVQEGVHYIELAPTKYWEDPTTALDDEIASRVEQWKSFGIDVVAFQSMLFLRPDLKLFESESNRRDTVGYMKKFLVLANKMGAKRLVFGSPKNRQRGDMSKEKADEIALEFFRELGDIAAANDVKLCIEPNALQYACDYITTAEEGANLVRSINSPGIGLHLDTACMHLAGDNIEQSIKANIDILEHFHISAPMLETVDAKSGIDYETTLQILKDLNYANIVSIEMKPDEGDNVARVKKTLQYIKPIA